MVSVSNGQVSFSVLVSDDEVSVSDDVVSVSDDEAEIPSLLQSYLHSIPVGGIATIRTSFS